MCLKFLTREPRGPVTVTILDLISTVTKNNVKIACNLRQVKLYVPPSGMVIDSEVTTGFILYGDLKE